MSLEPPQVVQSEHPDRNNSGLFVYKRQYVPYRKETVSNLSFCVFVLRSNLNETLG
jgi:hypothetical protein